MLRRKLNPSSGKMPPGGFWRVIYREHEFKEETFEALVAAIDGFNKTNGFELETVADRLETYFCETFPYLAHWVEDGAASVRKTDQNFLQQEILESLQRRTREQFKLDFVPYVMDRAEACHKCPFNKTFDGADVEVIGRYVSILTRDRAGELEKYQGKLGVCTLHRWHNGVEVWRDKPKDEASGASPDQPEHCWVK
jgi:hypothetical protein